MKALLLDKINDLIVELEQTLTSDEMSNGWNPQSQLAILKLLPDIREAIQRQGPLPELSIGRGLDHWGVEGGLLFDKCCEISNMLRKLRQE